MRKWRRPAAVELLARDLATAKVRDAIRIEVWALLRQAGLVREPEPPPSPRRQRRKPDLRLVEPRPVDPSPAT
jgi:hypothetical protein